MRVSSEVETILENAIYVIWINLVMGHFENGNIELGPLAESTWREKMLKFRQKFSDAKSFKDLNFDINLIGAFPDSRQQWKYFIQCERKFLKIITSKLQFASAKTPADAWIFIAWMSFFEVFVVFS